MMAEIQSTFLKVTKIVSLITFNCHGTTCQMSKRVQQMNYLITRFVHRPHFSHKNKFLASQ